jgi:hypothetical protein
VDAESEEPESVDAVETASETGSADADFTETDFVDGGAAGVLTDVPAETSSKAAPDFGHVFAGASDCGSSVSSNPPNRGLPALSAAATSPDAREVDVCSRPDLVTEGDQSPPDEVFSGVALDGRFVEPGG